MLTGTRIALIEDDEIMGASIAQRLDLEGAEVIWLKQAARAVGALRTPRAPIDAVVCDIRLPDGSGEEIYTTLCRTSRPPPFLFITGQGSIDQAVRLLRAGAGDFLTKPFDMRAFLERLALLARRRPEDTAERLTGISEAAQNVDARIAELAAQDGAALISGPSGTGKGRLARAMHRLSDRRSCPFVEVNLLRSPSPARDFEAALAEVGEGTLFLNGLGRMPSGLTGRLIASLPDPAFRPVASCGPRIAERIAAGAFPADLYYAFAAHEVVVPPLSDRPADAVWLLSRLFPGLNARREVPLAGISVLAEEAVREHPWPGNGREVRSRAAAGIAAARGEMLQPGDLFPEQATGEMVSLAEAREVAERMHIVMALARSEGHVSEAARLLKVSRTTLWEKMQRLGL